MLDTLKQGLLSLLVPASCPGCQRPLEQVAGPPLCPNCLNNLPRTKLTGCHGCGRPFSPATTGQSFCLDCRSRLRFYDQAVSACRYEGVIRSLIQAFKYQEQQALASFLGTLLVQTVQDRLGEHSWEGVLPIPLHPTRQRERGFNQAEQLAQVLAKTLELPLKTNWLARTRATRPQTELSREDRLRNLHRAFALKTSEPVPSRLLLVDDVLTTGATASACARLLKAAGAQQITVVTVAHG